MGKARSVTGTVKFHLFCFFCCCCSDPFPILFCKIADILIFAVVVMCASLLPLTRRRMGCPSTCESDLFPATATLSFAHKEIAVMEPFQLFMTLKHLELWSFPELFLKLM